MKRKFRITESNLRNIIRESIKNVLLESEQPYMEPEDMLGDDYDDIMNARSNGIDDDFDEVGDFLRDNPHFKEPSEDEKKYQNQISWGDFDEGNYTTPQAQWEYEGGKAAPGDGEHYDKYGFPVTSRNPFSANAVDYRPGDFDMYLQHTGGHYHPGASHMPGAHDFTHQGDTLFPDEQWLNDADKQLGLDDRYKLNPFSGNTKNESRLRNIIREAVRGVFKRGR